MSGKTLAIILAVQLCAVVLTGCTGSGSAGKELPDRQASSLQGELQRLTETLGQLDERILALETVPPVLPARNTMTPPSLSTRMIRVTDLPSLGTDDSQLAVIEVTDYECPFCQAHFRDTLPGVIREFVDSGRVRYFVLDYPLPGHDFAASAAVATSCAHQQQAFWSFHDELFRQAGSAEERDLISIADRLELDGSRFRQCLESRQKETFVEDRRSVATGLGIQGTPTFLIGRLAHGQVVSDLVVLPGLQSLEQFREVIERFENGQKQTLRGRY